jgi:hypothetical protein
MTRRVGARVLPTGPGLLSPAPMEFEDATGLRLRLQAITASLVIGLELMAGKFYAFWLTGSAAILSDALE